MSVVDVVAALEFGAGEIRRGTVPVGATKEDLERLNIKSDGPTVDLNKELDKNGGRLTLDDMIRLGMV